MKKTDPGGNEIIYQYDKENNIIRTDRKEITRDRVTNDIVSSRHFAETSIYDQLNRVTEKTNNLGNKVKYFYDSRNNIVKIIDPLDNATEIQYDLFNRLIETRQYLHQYIAGEREEPVNTRYTHNQFDFRTQQTDALGRATQFIYDSSGRQISSVLPDESADLISYDRMGNVILYKNRLGLQKIFNYDELNRNIELQVDTSTLADGEEIFGTINFKTMYDGAGRVLKLENDNIITEFIYNSIGWNLEERTSFKPLEGITFPPAVSIKRQFNNSSSQVGLIYPSNRKIEYVRDILERIIAIRQTQKGNAYPGNNASSENYTIAEIEYEGLQRKKIIRANNTTTEYKYDFGARVIEINHAINNNSFLNLQFLYDALGSMKLQVEAADDFETTQFYKHDSLGRLTKATATDIAETINLSILPASQLPIPEPIPYYQGQINALLPDGTLPEQRNYTYDKVENRERALLNGIENTYLLNKLDQYEIINTDSFDYNKNGNLKQNAGFTYSYNHLNQLSKFKKTGGNEVSFLYDALGRFCARLENGETSAMVYDGHNLLEEYENGLLKSSVVSNSGQDNLLVNSKDGNELYFYPDLNKSVRYLFNGEAKFNFYQYDDFGNILNSLITNDENQFRFGGKRFLSEVNKYDFIYRTYDPVIGRFIQRDPKGFVDGTNIYAFVRNNPLSMTDPFGTQSRDEVKDGSSGQQLPQVTSGGFWGEGWDDPLITTPTNNVYGGVLDILGHASKSVPNLSFGFIESLKEVKIPGGGKIIGDCYYKFKPYTFFEKFYKRNFLDRAISFPKNTFPSFFNGLRFLAPLNFFSDIKELADSINSDKNIPEKGADIVASSASLYSSSIGTAQLLGVNTTALSGSATIADTPLIAATALLAAAFAGGYAFGQWFDKKTGWHHSTATRGLKVEQALKDAGLNDTFSGIVGGVPLFHF